MPVAPEVTTVVKETVVYRNSDGMTTVPIAVSQEMEVTEEIYCTFDIIKKIEKE